MPLSSKPLSTDVQAELMAFANLVCTARLSKIEEVLNQVRANALHPVEALTQIEALCNPE
jgi:hypothetical protein